MKFRIMIIILIAGIFLLYNSSACLLVSLEGIPEIVSNNISGKTEMAFLLYGKGVCGVCPTGSYFYNQTSQKDVLVITPQDFSDNDIANLREAFVLRGPIIRGNDEVVTFLKRLASCSKLDDWKHNLSIKIIPGKEINSSHMKIF